MRLFLYIFLLFFPFPAAADGVIIYVSDNIHRGDPMAVRLESKNPTDAFRISWQEREFFIPAVCSDKICRADVILPADYEKSGKHVIVVSDTKKVVNIKDKKYPIQRLTVDPRFINLSKENQERAAKESAISREAIRRFTGERYWMLPLTRPVDGVVTSPFGVARVFNNEPRGKHNGIDFAGDVGTDVLVVADGVVILTGEHYFGGKSVFVDHGLGLVSVYLHLSEIRTAVGDKVSGGQVIGLVGATGRVTGPHLHLGVYAQGVAVDAIPLF